MFLFLPLLISVLELQENYGNSLKEDNNVYYCIYDVNANKYMCNQICLEPRKREQMKQEVSQIILEELWNILTKN